MTALWVYGALVAGCAVGILVAALVASGKDCDHCDAIVRHAYAVTDAWLSPNESIAFDVALADALHALADECAHGERVQW